MRVLASALHFIGAVNGGQRDLERQRWTRTLHRPWECDTIRLFRKRPPASHCGECADGGELVRRDRHVTREKPALRFGAADVGKGVGCRSERNTYSMVNTPTHPTSWPHREPNAGTKAALERRDEADFNIRFSRFRQRPPKNFSPGTRSIDRLPARSRNLQRLLHIRTWM